MSRSILLIWIAVVVASVGAVTGIFSRPSTFPSQSGIRNGPNTSTTLTSLKAGSLDLDESRLFPEKPVSIWSKFTDTIEKSLFPKHHEQLGVSSRSSVMDDEPSKMHTLSAGIPSPGVFARLRTLTDRLSSRVLMRPQNPPPSPDKKSLFTRRTVSYPFGNRRRPFPKNPSTSMDDQEHQFQSNHLTSVDSTRTTRFVSSLFSTPDPVTSQHSLAWTPNPTSPTVSETSNNDIFSNVGGYYTQQPSSKSSMFTWGMPIPTNPTFKQRKSSLDPALQTMTTTSERSVSRFVNHPTPQYSYKAKSKLGIKSERTPLKVGLRPSRRKSSQSLPSGGDTQRQPFQPNQSQRFSTVQNVSPTAPSPHSTKAPSLSVPKKDTVWWKTPIAAIQSLLNENRDMHQFLYQYSQRKNKAASSQLPVRQSFPTTTSTPSPPNLTTINRAVSVRLPSPSLPPSVRRKPSRSKDSRTANLFRSLFSRDFVPFDRPMLVPIPGEFTNMVVNLKTIL